jgi:hypothetical protein
MSHDRPAILGILVGCIVVIVVVMWAVEPGSWLQIWTIRAQLVLQEWQSHLNGR